MENVNKKFQKEDLVHILRIICSLVIALVALLVIWTSKRSDTKSNRSVDPYWGKKIEQEKPQAIFLGDSILNEGVDTEEFMKATKVPTLKVWNPGAGSAWFYVAIKNVIIKCNHKPEVLIIFFRDHFLTDPTFRTGGKYREEIDRLANEEEPLLDRIAYGKDFFTHFLNERDRVKTSVERLVKYCSVSVFMKLEKKEVDSAIDNVFEEKNMVQSLVTRQQLKAESSDKINYNFSSAMKNSFLPEIIRITQDNQIRFIFIRMKRRPQSDGEIVESPELIQYINDLKTYLGKKNIPLIDFTYEKMIRLEHYGAGDHLNRTEGRKLFLPLLTQSLASYL